MRIKLSDPVRTDDLVDFLRRCDCTVDVVGAGLLEVEPRELPIDPVLRRPELELDAYLSDGLAPTRYRPSCGWQLTTDNPR
jgi:hypothetical protein